MKKALLFVLALAVIPGGVDAQAPDLEETRASPAPPATPRTAQITACSSSAPITCSR